MYVILVFSRTVRRVLHLRESRHRTVTLSWDRISLTKTELMLGNKMFRVLLFILLTTTGLAQAQPQERLPIIFIHGSGDWANKWMTTIWRFESNGYPRELMFPVDMPYPSATMSDSNPAAGTSRQSDQAAHLAELVQAVKAETGAEKVILIANSRGGTTSLAYIRNHGGADHVALLIATGTPFHGIGCLPFFMQDFEFNGCGDMAPKLLTEPLVPDGVQLATLRSDRFDKFAQPYLDVGFARIPFLGAGYDGPDLPGADNQVLPGLDHREVAYSPAAFEALWERVTGSAPNTTNITPEPAITLTGRITGWLEDRPTNLPEEGVQVQVFRLDVETGERLGDPLLDMTTGSDGAWGPVATDPMSVHEWVISPEGGPDMSVIRPPLARSASVMDFRLGKLPEGEEGVAPLATLELRRPAGYLDDVNDVILINGDRPDGLKDGRMVPTIDRVEQSYETPPDGPIAVQYNDVSVMVSPDLLSADRLVKVYVHN